jgi:DNA-binding Xre family transcriptional regulator
MAVSYKKLWKMLIDRDMKKKDLIELCDISKYTIARMNNNENISVETIAKICNALRCGFDDIMELIEDKED